MHHQKFNTKQSFNSYFKLHSIPIKQPSFFKKILGLTLQYVKITFSSTNFNTKRFKKLVFI